MPLSKTTITAKEIQLLKTLHLAFLLIMANYEDQMEGTANYNPRRYYKGVSLKTIKDQFDSYGFTFDELKRSELIF